MIHLIREEMNPRVSFSQEVSNQSNTICEDSEFSSQKKQLLPLRDAVQPQLKYTSTQRVASDPQIPLYTRSSCIAPSATDDSDSPAIAKHIKNEMPIENTGIPAQRTAQSTTAATPSEQEMAERSCPKSNDPTLSQINSKPAVVASSVNKSSRRKLQDFEFGSFLGGGALGRVYHARHVATGNEVAIKVVQKSRIANETMRVRIFAERSILKDLNHPSIIRLQCTFQDDAALYFVLELGGFTNLSEKLMQWGGTLPYDIAKFYTGEIVGIISYLRSKSVAHRDLKPHNLLVSKDGHLKLIDFNSAIVLPTASSPSTAMGISSNLHPSDPSTTCIHADTIQLVGTMAYAPPELFDLRENVGFAADLWALGCITYQLFVGHSPFSEGSEQTMRERISAVQYHFPKGFPSVVEDFVQTLLRFDPQKRLGVTNLNELTEHPFLKDLNISQIHKCTLPMDLYETEQFEMPDFAKNELEDF